MTRGAAVGFSVHTGWAAAVAIAGRSAAELDSLIAEPATPTRHGN